MPVDEQHLHMDFMNGETPPVPVPPVSQGWDAMRELLDAHMPPPKPPRKWPPTRLWTVVAVVAAGSTLGIWKMRKHHAPSKQGITAVQSAPVADSLTNIPITDGDSIQQTIAAVQAGDDIRHDSIAINNHPGVSREINTGNTSGTNANGHTNGTSTVAGVPVDAHKNNTSAPNAHLPGNNSATTRNNANTAATNVPVPHPFSKHTPATTPGSARHNTARNGHGRPTTATVNTGNNHSVDKTQLTTAAPTARAGTAASSSQTTSAATHPAMGSNNLYAGTNAITAAAPLHALFTDDRLFHPASLRGRDSLNGRSNLTLPPPPPQQQNDALTGWRIWLQWNPALPLQGSSNYFKGPDGSNQVWRPFVPGLRVTRSLGPGSLALDITPLTSQQTDAVFYRDTGFSQDSVSQQDSVRYTRSVVKQFGSAAALQYQYPLSRHWGVSAGVGGSYWKKALTRYRTEVVQPASVTDSLKPSTTKDLKHFSKMRIDGMAEVYYQAGRIQAGLRIAVPITGMGSDSARRYHNPVQAALVVRWNFLSLKKRK